MHRHDVAARELSIRRARYRIEAQGAVAAGRCARCCQAEAPVVPLRHDPNGMLAVAVLVESVAAALIRTGIEPEGPIAVPPSAVPQELAPRVPDALQVAWEQGVSRLSWSDHERERLGRDARHGGLWFMTPGQAA